MFESLASCFAFRCSASLNMTALFMRIVPSFPRNRPRTITGLLPAAAHEQPDVQRQPDAPSSAVTVSGVVWHEVRRRPVAAGQPPARARLAADAHADAPGGARSRACASCTRSVRSLVMWLSDSPSITLTAHEAERGDRGAAAASAGDRRRTRPVAGQRAPARASRAAAPPCSTASRRTAGRPTSATISGDQRPRSPAAGGQQREHDADAQHHVAAVEARVAEQRGDAEEVRVRVRDGEVGRVEEELVGGRLPEAHGGEQRRQRERRRRPARAAPSRGSRPAPTDGQQRRERQREEREQVGARPRGRRPTAATGRRSAKKAAAGSASTRGSAPHGSARGARASRARPPRRRARSRAAAAGPRRPSSAIDTRKRFERREVERRPERGGQQDGHRHQAGPARRAAPRRRRARASPSSGAPRRRRRS